MPSLTEIIKSDPLNKAGVFSSIGVLGLRAVYETHFFYNSMHDLGPFLKNELAHGVTTFTLTSIIYDYMRKNNNSSAVSFATALAGGILWNGMIETAQYYAMGQNQDAMADIFLRGIGLGMGAMVVYKYLKNYSSKRDYLPGD